MPGKVTETPRQNQSKDPFPWQALPLYFSKDSWLMEAISGKKRIRSAKCPSAPIMDWLIFMGFESIKNRQLLAFYTAAKFQLRKIFLSGILQAQDLQKWLVPRRKNVNGAFRSTNDIFNVGKDLANARRNSHLDIFDDISFRVGGSDGNVPASCSSNVRILMRMGKPSGLVSFKGGAGLRPASGQ